MQGPYKYEMLHKYPHLSMAESEIINRFIFKYPDAFDKAYYDVELGNIRGTTENLLPEWEKNALYLGKYKIDALFENDKFFCVVEVKKSATTKALGEIWLYDALFKKEWEPKKPVLNYIITDEEMPNIREVCEAEKVGLYVV